MKFEDEYIELEEAIEYIYKETGVKQHLVSRRKKFLNSSNDSFWQDKIRIEEDMIYINRKYMTESIELYNKSIMVSHAAQIIKEHGVMNDEEGIIRQLKRKCDVYTIPLMNKINNFIQKEDLNNIIKGVEEIKSKECIDFKQLIEVIEETFKWVNFHKVLIHEDMKKNGLEIINSDYIGCFEANNKTLYPKVTVKKFIEILNLRYENKKIKLVNMSYEEYINMDKKFFEENYKELSSDEMEKLNNGRVNKIGRLINLLNDETDIKGVSTNGRVYVSIKEYEDHLKLMENYIPLASLVEEYGDSSISFAKNNNIDAKKYKNRAYINKKDLEKFIAAKKYLQEFRKANTIYDKFMVKLKYCNNDKKDKFPNFNHIYKKFARHVNKTNNTFYVANKLFVVYEMLLNNITTDLQKYNKDKNDKLFKKALVVAGESRVKREVIFQFNNYLVNELKYDLANVSNKRKVSTPIPEYSSVGFINLLIKLIDIVADKNNLKKLYRNWRLSTAVTYVFMHYCVAWRKMDLVKQLPCPNLENVNGVSDGESFIRWLEEGNEISDEMAYRICREIETITKRMNLRASKNNQRLSCIISNSLAKEVATLLCISEANKQIYMTTGPNPCIRYTNLFNAKYTEPVRINKIILQNFNIDITEVLEEPFDNIKMNKSFLRLVKNKAEELGLAYSYYYAQITRGHKATNGLLAETTKIYLKKEISKASFMAFSTGTMGSVLHAMMKLIDDDYGNKSYLEQIEAINKLDITPYTIENNVSKIFKKTELMKEEINQYLSRGGKKESILQGIFYEQTSYGIDERTKCLLKITRRDELGITRIRSVNRKNENIISCPLKRKSCIGCDYMIALRYFIYEFEKKFTEAINELENCESEIDKEIWIEAVNEIYIPILNDLAVVLGKEVSNVIDMKRYYKLAEKI